MKVKILRGVVPVLNELNSMCWDFLYLLFRLILRKNGLGNNVIYVRVTKATRINDQKMNLLFN